jgi:hypothetical protein
MEEIFTKIDYQDDGPPPRSRRLVAVCSWSWSPAHSRTEAYWVSGSLSRREWSLWCKPTDPDLGTYWFNPAYATFEHPKSARDAAKALLKAAWSAEWKSCEAPGPGAEVDQTGLLVQRDIEEVEAATYESNDLRSSP